MNCKKCKYCIQVSANKYEVKCAKKEVAENKENWIPEPSYCAFYEKGSYTRAILTEWQICYAIGRLEEMERRLMNMKKEADE